MRFFYLAHSALGLTRLVLGDRLLASHYTGKIFTISLTTEGTNGTLQVTSTATGCGNMPSWLTLDSETGTIYCVDESEIGGPVASTFSVGADGVLAQTGQTTTSGGNVYGWYYGGPDGKSFLAMPA
jgi:hypothetical protein